MLVGAQYSAMHSLRSDETWHYYDGTATLLLHIIEKDGEIKTVKIGNPRKDKEAVMVYTVERN